MQGGKCEAQMVAIRLLLGTAFERSTGEKGWGNQDTYLIEPSSSKKELYPHSTKT